MSAVKEAPKPTEWRMPVARKGDIVLWYPGGVVDEDRSCPAMVVKVQHNSVSLRVFGTENDLRFECVKHVNDPFAREYERGTEGGWSLC